MSDGDRDDPYHDNIAAYIPVDTVKPENNGGVMVLPFSDVEIANVEIGTFLLNGVALEKHVDIRDLSSNKYKAFLVSDHEVLLVEPAVPFPFLHLSEKVYEKQEAHGLYCDRAQQGREVVKNAILHDKGRQTKRIMLVFPDEYPLTMEHTSRDNKKTGEIPFELIPIQSEYTVGGMVHKITDVFMQWKLHYIEETPRFTKSADNSAEIDDAEAQLTARLGGMDVS
jgi:hypothetical protein